MSSVATSRFARSTARGSRSPGRSVSASTPCAATPKSSRNSRASPMAWSSVAAIAAAVVGFAPAARVTHAPSEGTGTPRAIPCATTSASHAVGGVPGTGAPPGSAATNTPDRARISTSPSSSSTR